jgi:hypothetical protein
MGTGLMGTYPINPLIMEGEGSVDREEADEKLAELRDVILENRPST